MRIYVGKLTSRTSEKDLHSFFGKYGHITSVYIRKEEENGKIHFYGILEMPVKKQAIAAIKAINGSKLNGLNLSIHTARLGAINRRKYGRGGGRRNYDSGESESQ